MEATISRASLEILRELFLQLFMICKILERISLPRGV